MFTIDIQGRIWKHRNKHYPDSFTARYELVCFERYGLITRAIVREKELRGWLRSRKIALIAASNPDLIGKI